jgi:ribosomal protein S18 acetylase RimI-like enzyme
VERTQQSAQAGQADIRLADREDCDALAKFLADLSLRTRYLRFFAGVLPASPAMLSVLTGDRRDITALVATEQGAIIGHAMAAYTPDCDQSSLAHIGVVVADARQGQGVGSALMRALTAAIRDHGTRTMLMEVLPENRRVLTMIADRWPAARYERSADCVTIRASLAEPALDAA